MNRLLVAAAFVLLVGLLVRAHSFEVAQASVREPGWSDTALPADRVPAGALTPASESSVSQAAGATAEPASLTVDFHVWIKVADCESGDGDGQPPYRASWHYNGLHDGGLQFVPSTWNAAKRLPEVRAFAARYGYAYQAPAWVQIRVADNWRRHTSWLQWPTCSRKLGLR